MYVYVICYVLYVYSVDLTRKMLCVNGHLHVYDVCYVGIMSTSHVRCNKCVSSHLCVHYMLYMHNVDLAHTMLVCASPLAYERYMFYV